MRSRTMTVILATLLAAFFALPASATGGTSMPIKWLNPKQTLAHVTALRARLGVTSVDRPICLLRGLTS